MNSVLINSKDVMTEIKEIIKDIDNIKARVDIFAEVIKSQITESTT